MWTGFCPLVQRQGTIDSCQEAKGQESGGQEAEGQETGGREAGGGLGCEVCAP